MEFFLLKSSQIPLKTIVKFISFSNSHSILKKVFSITIQDMPDKKKCTLSI